MREYAAAVPVAVVIGTAVTSWDRPLPAGANVADNLWLCLSCLVGVFLTAAVSTLFAISEHRDILLQPLLDRLRLVEEVLKSCASGIPVPAEIVRQINDAVLAGNSSWRLTLRRSGASRPDRDRLGATGALITRLVDIAANLPSLPPAGPARAQVGQLAGALAEFRAVLRGEREPSRTNFGVLEGGSLPIRQIAHTLELMGSAWAQPINMTADRQASTPAWWGPDLCPSHGRFDFCIHSGVRRRFNGRRVVHDLLAAIVLSWSADRTRF